jgi:hypothetical protein
LTQEDATSGAGSAVHEQGRAAMSLVVAGLFTTDPVWQAAYQQVQAIDRVAGPADRAWGLWEPVDPELEALGMPNRIQHLLDKRLLVKLDQVPGAHVLITSAAGRGGTGSTELFGKVPQAQEPVDLTGFTADELRHWRKAHSQAKLSIVVKVSAGISAITAGFLVEVLVHELAAHAEPFADFLIEEEAMEGFGTLDPVDVQHAKLHSGNPRYRLLGAGYVTTYQGADQGPAFRKRMLLDTIANATLPPGV